jgi:beta-galactosidase GanA
MRHYTASTLRRLNIYGRRAVAMIGMVGILPWTSVVSAQDLPKVRKEGAAVQLVVDGRPWTALAGEVHNSSASNAAYMAPIWDRLAAQNLNTVITPAYWELIEPKEGQFDFALVDAQLPEARQRKMRIVLLWFGTIKNAKSSYAPEWVRADRKRFPRAVTRPSTLPFAKGEAPLSVFGDAIGEADARAFSALMGHLAQVDPQHTVIAVQVENETGVLGDSRDRSAAADAAWNGPVPSSLMTYLGSHKGRLAPSLDALWRSNGQRKAGTWSQVFGNSWEAEELFMAWGTSRMVERVAAAGKNRLALPMYANAWIGPQKPGEPAGNYPSGGPVPRVFDIWYAGAPSLDWLSPDIYVEDFTNWATQYARSDNMLFVPETRFVAGNLFVALGQYRATGFAPFGIEDGVPGNQIGEAYGVLNGLGGIIGDAQENGTLTGFALAPGETHKATFGDYVVTVKGQRETVSKMLLDMGISVPTEKRERRPQNIGNVASDMTDTRPMGLVIQLGKEDFLVVGQDVNISFARKASNGGDVELAEVEEGRFVDGRWVPGRVINGDERLSIVPSDSFGMTRIRILPTQ